MVAPRGYSTIFRETPADARKAVASNGRFDFTRIELPVVGRFGETMFIDPVLADKSEVRGLLPPAKPLREDPGDDNADKDPDAACQHVSNSLLPRDCSVAGHVFHACTKWHRRRMRAAAILANVRGNAARFLTLESGELNGIDERYCQTPRQRQRVRLHHRRRRQ